MTAIIQTRFWTGPRLYALATVSLVTALFIGANAHLISVAFSSKPDCVLHPPSEGTAALRAAKPSC
ncbi:MAG TPA: hypothetical protein ENH56_09935 [Roseobacter sp.]|uniref:Uncharacterized protein n=1 Tax=marine sediment metagenome TaxID=412755 RepID=A0A0F9M472_9ZZZZ|nr:hypothetical protein [Roseobacter sp.]|tara:strand:- start:1828 stop:2025 length:198 start_codon:yes stop_codon:yes gene_type:complete